MKFHNFSTSKEPVSLYKLCSILKFDGYHKNSPTWASSRIPKAFGTWSTDLSKDRRCRI